MAQLLSAPDIFPLTMQCHANGVYMYNTGVHCPAYVFCIFVINKFNGAAKCWQRHEKTTPFIALIICFSSSSTTQHTIVFLCRWQMLHELDDFHKSQCRLNKSYGLFPHFRYLYPFLTRHPIRVCWLIFIFRFIHFFVLVNWKKCNLLAHIAAVALCAVPMISPFIFHLFDRSTIINFL